MIIQFALAAGIVYAGIETYRATKKRPLSLLLAEQRKNSPVQQRRTYASRRHILSHMRQQTTDSSRHTIHTNLALALAALVLTSVGSVTLPVLTLLSLPLLSYLVVLFIRDSAITIVWKRRVRMVVVDALVTTSLVALGYFWAASLYMSFYYVSRKLVLNAQDTYHHHLGEAIGDIPRCAWVWRDGTEVYTPIHQIKKYDDIIIHAGDYIPVHGRILYGEVVVDQRAVTGKSQPIAKKPGDSVYAATFVVSGTSRVRVAQHGTEMIADQIGDVVHRMSSYASSLTTRSEAVGDSSVIPVLALSAVTFALVGPISALAILCSYIGYAMRILGPLSVLNFLERSAYSGILIKDGQVLDTIHHVDTIIFDTTGMLTSVNPLVGTIYPFAPYTESDIVRYAATAESKHPHASARSILQAAQARNLSLFPIDEVRYHVRNGVTMYAGEHIIRVGSERFMHLEGIAIPDSVATIQSYCVRRGYSLVYVAIDEQVGGVLEIRAALRPEAAFVIQELQQRGVSIHLVSDDYEQRTHQIAQHMGIDTYGACASPEDTAALVDTFQRQGKTVCFVGDDFNDSLALKHACVSISLLESSTIATDTAQIILLDNNLEQLLRLFELADQLKRTMTANMLLSMIPGMITIGGVYLVHFGLLSAYVLYYAGFTAGITNALSLLKSQE